MTALRPQAPPDAELLLLEDDTRLSEVLANALSRRGFKVTAVASLNAGRTALAEKVFTHAVLDLSLPDGSGLELIPALTEGDQHALVVVLTGYASIATAVEAIKLGAVHYLTKPTDADAVMTAFDREQGRADVPLAEAPPSIERLQWEHINKVLLECGGNISEAARRLNMHRRTLQRRLQKHPVKR